MADNDVVVHGQRDYTFTVPATEVYVPVTEREWNRLRTRIKALQKHEKVYFSIAWAAVGVLVSAVFGAIGWAQPYATLPPAQQLEFTWIWIVIVGAGALELAAAAAMFTAGILAARAEVTAASEIVEDMDDIHAPAIKVP